MDKFTAQREILSANLLDLAQTIPKNGQFVQLILLNFAFSKGV